jgi:hypothetical protein
VLSGLQANLFSDLLVHNMGPGLADGVSRTASSSARLHYGDWAREFSSCTMAAPRICWMPSERTAVAAPKLTGSLTTQCA